MSLGGFTWKEGMSRRCGRTRFFHTQKLQQAQLPFQQSSPMSQPVGLAGHTRWGEEVLVTGWEGGEETGKMALFLNRKSAVQGVSF